MLLHCLSLANISIAALPAGVQVTLSMLSILPFCASATLVICDKGYFRIAHLRSTPHPPQVRDFLDGHAPAPYTCALTIQCGARLPSASVHASRLNIPIHALLSLVTSLRAALIEHLSDSELCMVAIAEDSSSRVHALAFPRASRPHLPPSVRVQVGGAPRLHPNIKCASWSAARRPLEAVRRRDCAETLLVDTTGRLYEGSVSNVFFVTENHTLVTAPAHAVLPGTTRAAVLKLCANSGVDVELRYPRVDELRAFAAAFLTSVTRILDPIDAIRYDGMLLKLPYKAHSKSFLDGLRDDVWSSILDDSLALDSD